MSMSSGQDIRAALNRRIRELEAAVTSLIDAERVDELTEFRITVNRILTAHGEPLNPDDSES